MALAVWTSYSGAVLGHARMAGGQNLTMTDWVPVNVGISVLIMLWKRLRHEYSPTIDKRVRGLILAALLACLAAQLF